MDETLRSRWLDLAQARIANAGLHSGAARARVVDALSRHAQCLTDARAIFERLHAEGQPGSQASVYRILDELYGLGLLHRSNDKHGVALYEIAHPDRRHHHVVDEETGAVQPFEDAKLERAIHDAARRAGIRLTSHEVLLRGTRLTD